MKRLPRPEMLLVLACAAASALLAASQFTNMFELTPPGGEVLRTIDAADQHGYATLVLAILALVLLVVAMAAGGDGLSQGACFAVAVCGVVALLIFLVIDLPDAGSIGPLKDESFVDAKAEPAAGFWFELVGSLVLTAGGAALATLAPERVRMLSRRRRAAEAGGSEKKPGGSFEASGSSTGSGGS